ncbi:MAG: hypothetical protein SFW67_35705 [Myxococcaceae bacterium]|nr:hypothetical protein [Myxococcaceae bacterium]
MTTGRVVQVVTAASTLIAIGVTAMVVQILQHAAVPVLSVAVSLLVLGVVGLTIAWAPRSVRLDDDALVLERLAWPELRFPLSDLASAEEGPRLGALGGGVWRVAGNGGVMGFTGLFHVRGIGLVRLWATQLGTPTVLLRRHTGRPLLLGVDDARGLLEALARRLKGSAPHR